MEILLTSEIQKLTERVAHESLFIESLTKEINKTIVGQQYMIERLILAVLSDGHVLLEGVPGLAKTLAIKSLSAAIDVKFNRIQFTPDLLPSDLLGTMIYNHQKNEFTVKQGPIFSNFVLADEINRASAKVQSALLQAMQERQITIGDITYTLDDPFLVLATQNPIEQEGTYPLPEAQVDRFMMKLIITYPSPEEEVIVMRQNISNEKSVIKKVISPLQILQARKVIRDVYLDKKVEEYIINIVFATRFPEKYKLSKLQKLLQYGSSPRGSINLALASKALAFMKHRGYVLPEDVQEVCHDVLRHRIGMTYEAEAENITTDEIIGEVLKTVTVP